jgi:hypothetical protein
MNFLIADTFTGSLARLTAIEQKAAKTTAFDLQLNPAGLGTRFHRLDGARDRNFWSARVNDDLRIIAHLADDSFLFCYVDHHDRAYDWASRRKLQTHPRTGAAQLVEVRQTVQEVFVRKYVEVDTPAPARQPFASLSDSDLLDCGVPEEWLADVRSADEESLLRLVNHLPVEAAEALLELATGGKPRQLQAPVRTRGLSGAALQSPFDHPDARRRFRVVNSPEELQRILDAAGGSVGS